MQMSYWLLKTEPEEFSFDDLVRNGREVWNGVKAPKALANIAKIKTGDNLFIYHTGKEKSIIGVGAAVSGPYPDPSLGDASRLVLEVSPLYRLERSVTLKEVKAEPAMQSWELARLPRLSVMPVTLEQWAWVHRVSATADRTSKVFAFSG